MTSSTTNPSAAERLVEARRQLAAATTAAAAERDALEALEARARAGDDEVTAAHLRRVREEVELAGLRVDGAVASVAAAERAVAEGERRAHLAAVAELRAEYDTELAAARAAASQAVTAYLTVAGRYSDQRAELGGDPDRYGVASDALPRAAALKSVLTDIADALRAFDGLAYRTGVADDLRTFAYRLRGDE